MKRIITIIVSVVGGLIFATVVVWAGWNTQIERRAYQCNDDIWPCAWITTDMSDHRDAGDTLSPGWTWEKIECVGRMYHVGFFVLWAGSTALIATVWIKRQKQNKPSEAIQQRPRTAFTEHLNGDVQPKQIHCTQFLMDGQA